jgi:hypothetical protein
MYYRRLCIGVTDKGQLIPSNELNYEELNREKDAYISIFEYNDKQYQEFRQKGTVAGIVDVTTTRLVWDFDSKDTPETAKNDCRELVSRLQERGLKEEHIVLGFSGNKGFAVEVELEHRIGVREFKNITSNLALGLSTYDRVVSNASRIVRIFGTKHQKSGLYKKCMALSQLALPMEDIRKYSSSLEYFPAEATTKVTYNPTEELLSLGKTAKEATKPPIALDDLTLTNKPKHMSNCRWMLQNGAFGTGERNTAFLVLAAYYKSQGFEKEHTYRLLKGVAEIQAGRNNCDRFSDVEIWTTVISVVYGINWKDGVFSCRQDNSWLGDYCASLGTHKCNHIKESLSVEIGSVHDFFKDYATKYEENILFSGIDELDDRFKLMVGTSNAIVAPPGVGKTSLISKILNYNSSQNVLSVFFSYDMYKAAMYLRLIQKHTGLSQDEIYHNFRHDKKKTQEFAAVIAEQYKNVRFCFQAGQSMDELQETIDDVQDKTGRKVKLAAIDYNELISTPYSDSTTASAYVAQRTRQIGIEKDVCMLTLLQPSKLHSTPAEEITSFNSAKGSSAITQALTVMLGLSRPGFDPRKPENDKFFNITCLKNRNGPLFSLDFHWDGLKGEIDSLSPEERGELDMLRVAKEQKKEMESF